jgi:hypothetical protein
MQPKGGCDERGDAWVLADEEPLAVSPLAACRQPPASNVCAWYSEMSTGFTEVPHGRVSGLVNSLWRHEFTLLLVESRTR